MDVLHDVLTVAKPFVDLKIERSNEVSYGNMARDWQWYSEDPRRLQSLVQPSAREKEILELRCLQLCKHKSGLPLFVRSNIMDFVQNSIEYCEVSAMKAYTPVETLAASAGVCLEFANLTCSLINLVEPGRCFVVVGRETPSSQNLHAWIEYDGVPWEPQDGRPLLIAMPPNPNDYHMIVKSDIFYQPCFKYNEVEFVDLDESTPRELMRKFIASAGKQRIRSNL